MFALQPELKIFAGSANRDLAERICKYVGVPLGQATISSFPDGETYVRIEENIRGHDVFIIQPTCPPTNQHLMELLIMVDAARRASADRITAVIPFFGYARQDRKDQPRVPITAKLVANLLHAAGVSRVLTMDLHAQQVQGFFDIPVDHLYSLPVLIKYLRQQLTGKTVVVSPDLGGLKMASAYAEALGANLAIVAKERRSATETEALYLIGEVENHDVRKLRARGLIPAVIYGGNNKPQALQVTAREMNAVMSHASGENVLVELEISGEGSNRTALVQEVQHSPVGGEIRHVDFHAISMDQMIQAEVPLEPTGTAVGVKTFGGLLEQSLRALAVECLPADLPDRVTVDVSQLNIGDSIHVRDIQLPSGVTAKVQPDLTAFSVVAPVVEEEPVVAEAEAAAGPEVITEKKEEAEAAAPAPTGKEKAPKEKEQKK